MIDSPSTSITTNDSAMADATVSTNTPANSEAPTSRKQRRLIKRYTPSLIQQIRGKQFWLKHTEESVGQFRIYEVVDIFPATGKVSVRRIYGNSEEARKGYTPIYTLTAPEFDANFEPFTNQAQMGMSEDELRTTLGAEQGNTGTEITDKLEPQINLGDDVIPSSDAVV